MYKIAFILLLFAVGCEVHPMKPTDPGSRYHPAYYETQPPEFNQPDTSRDKVEHNNYRWAFLGEKPFTSTDLRIMFYNKPDRVAGVEVPFRAMWQQTECLYAGVSLICLPMVEFKSEEYEDMYMGGAFIVGFASETVEGGATGGVTGTLLFRYPGRKIEKGKAYPRRREEFRFFALGDAGVMPRFLYRYDKPREDDDEYKEMYGAHLVFRINVGVEILVDEKKDYYLRLGVGYATDPVSTHREKFPPMEAWFVSIGLCF